MFSLLTSRHALCKSKLNRPSIPEKWLLVRVSKTIFSGCSSSTWRWKENWEQKGELTINKHKSNSKKICSCICSGSWRLARPGSRFHLSHQTLRGRFLENKFKKFSHFHWSMIMISDQSSFADRIGAYSRLQWEPTGSYLQINFPPRILKKNCQLCQKLFSLFSRSSIRLTLSV